MKGLVGKGVAYARAEGAVRDFVGGFGLPFLPTPMGKGVVSDLDERCVAPARSRALLESDLIILLGARLNWMLHFGRAPRFGPDVKVVQVDLMAEELHQSVSADVALHGDVGSVAEQLGRELANRGWRFPRDSDWWGRLRDKCRENKVANDGLASDTSVPLNYYAVFHQIRSLIPEDAIIVNEGANTMDIGRTMFPNNLPRHRLDAGTFGTMGVGLGYAIAAALWCRDHAPGKRVVCVQGDSAFGFGGMEMETVFRYQLPIVVIIINNNGIYSGFDEESWESLREGQDLPVVTLPTSLIPNCHYENMMQMFGKRGHFCTTVDHVKKAVLSAMKETDSPSMINVMISPFAARKPQQFEWLTRSKM